MDKVIHIAECQEPWIYWWELLDQETKERLWSIYMPGVEYPSETGVRRIWERVQPSALQDYDWITLADQIFRDHYRFTPEQQKEIWRQVYRIASDRI